MSGFRASTSGLLLPVLLCWATAACAPGEPEEDGTSVTRLRVWAHAGQEAERDVLLSQVRRFNGMRDDVRVRLTLIPEGSYNVQVQAAAVAGDLPDLLEFDGPFVYAYVWQGHLSPLDDLLSEDVRSDLLPSLVQQGTYRGRLYAVGAFDSGLGLYADRSRLESVGARIPASPADAWTLEELTANLDALAEHDPDGAVLDLKLNYAGEWYTYGFSPLIQSAGGDLIDRRTYGTARGALDGVGAVRAMSLLQEWMEEGLVDPNIDDAAFVTGRVALALGGHWNFRGYAEALGEDLVLLPMPDLGTGSKTGQGSWNWAVTVGCKARAAAADFLEFLLSPDEVLAMANANGAIPGSRTAVARSRLYGEGGPLRLFATQLVEGYAVPRPRSPGYAVITAAFQEAVDGILAGGDVRRILDRTVRTIDDEIEDNRGYPWVAG